MAETITIDIPHKLSREEARRRIAEGFGSIREQVVGNMLKFKDEWDGDRLNFRAGMMGQNVVGRLDVLDDRVHVEIELPTLFAAIADKLRGRIQRDAQVLLEKK